MLILTVLASAPPAGADPAGEYHEAARFGGFDESVFHGGALTPGKFMEPTGFAADAEGNLFVADRTSPVSSNPASWRIQELSSTGTVLATTTFTLPGGLEGPSTIAGLAVDDAAKRVYGLVMGPAKAVKYHAHATQAQELLAWSIKPEPCAGACAAGTGGELVAAPGVKAGKDPLGSSGGLVAEQKQLEAGATPLYDPQGIVVDHLEQAGVDNPVAIEATNPRGLATNASGEVENEPAPVEGVKLFELEQHGETIVQQVATQASIAGALGATLKRWPPAIGTSEARTLAEQWGPLGIFDGPDGSISILLNARGSAPYPPSHTTSADVIHLNAKLETALVVNNAANDPAPQRGKRHIQGERRAILGLDPGPFFTEPAGAGDPPFELRNAGPEMAELAGGLYAADLRFEASPRETKDEQEEGELPIWLSYDKPEWRSGSGDKKINVGIRLLKPSSGTGQISGERGETILGTLGNDTKGAPCDIAGEEAALSAGAGGALWVLDRGPTASTLGEGLGLRPGREIIELEPGAGGETSGCPQPSSQPFKMGQCAATQSAEEPLTVPNDAAVAFDAGSVHLTHGHPFAYEWSIDYEGHPLKSENELLEAQEGQEAIEFTPEKPGNYTVGLTLWNDYGPHAMNAATVEVTSVQTQPEARFSARGLAGTQQESFKAIGQSGTCGPILHYRWNWGDGSGEEDETPEAAHAYAAAGSYAVTLEIVNSRYERATATQTVEVSAASAEPSLIALEPIIPLAATPPGLPSTPSSPRPSRGPTRVFPRASFAHGTMRVAMSCPVSKVSCAGIVQVQTAAAFPARASGRTKARASRLLLGQARFTMPGGVSRGVTMRLSAKGAALLTRLRRLPVLVVVAAHDPLGDPSLTTVHLTLAARARA
jgi:PKD repeat protein